MKRFLVIATIAALLIGAMAFSTTISRSPFVQDVDEAAWIFDSYYYRLYRSGAWDDPAWHVFDQHGMHPPAAMYAYGILFEAMGRPITSIIPKQIWFSNDLMVEFDRQRGKAHYPTRFLLQLATLIGKDRLLAARTLAAACAFLAAVATLVLAWRIAGPLAGFFAYALLLMHPAFHAVAGIATADSLLLFFQAMTILAAYELARAKGWALSLGMLALLAVAFGLAVATKFSAFLLMPIVLLTVVLTRRGTVRSGALGAALLAMLLGFGVAVLLDPGLHDAPLAEMWERIMRRAARIELQHHIFVQHWLRSWWMRTLYVVRVIFFSGIAPFILFLFAWTGTVAGIASRTRRRLLVPVLFLVSLVATICLTPMSWMRYAAAFLPVIALAGGFGIALVVEDARCWDCLNEGARKGLLFGGVVVALCGSIGIASFSRQGQVVPPPSIAEMERAEFLGISLQRSGEDAEAHRRLLHYFEMGGDEVRAAHERLWLDRMKREGLTR